MRFYIAAPSGLARPALTVARFLEEFGHKLTHNWMLEVLAREAAGLSDATLTKDEARIAARADASGVVRADVVVAILDGTSAGRCAEVFLAGVSFLPVVALHGFGLGRVVQLRPCAYELPPTEDTGPTGEGWRRIHPVFGAFVTHEVRTLEELANTLTAIDEATR